MATVSNIDWPKSTFVSYWELVHYVNVMSSMHANAVIFQARPAGDALYNSTIEPWSKYVILVFASFRCLKFLNKEHANSPVH